VVIKLMIFDAISDISKPTIFKKEYLVVLVSCLIVDGIH
jgi:hypothetical protein